jgi:hypothetical protein
MPACAGVAGEVVAVDAPTASVRRAQLEGTTLRWVEDAASSVALPPAATVLALARVTDAACAMCVVPPPVDTCMRHRPCIDGEREHLADPPPPQPPSTGAARPVDPSHDEHTHASRC